MIPSTLDELMKQSEDVIVRYAKSLADSPMSRAYSIALALGHTQGFAYAKEWNLPLEWVNKMESYALFAIPKEERNKEE